MYKQISIIFFVSFFLLNYFCFKAETKIQGYENTASKELDYDEFTNLVISEINKKRGVKGLLPLAFDPIATSIAKSHAQDQIVNKYLSYCNLRNECPDERYTLAGGSGAIVEVIKGFERDFQEEPISLTPLLAKYLVDSLSQSEDDLKVVLSPYITHIGFGHAFDKYRFSGVIEFVTITGEFSPIKMSLKVGEKLHVAGKVKEPYKFKAISVAYFDRYELAALDDKSRSYFDIDHLRPYFPPQDYIAYGSTSRSNFIKIIQGIGLIGAIGASPFTGGASAILAPIFIHGLQNSPPREIPLKGGIKVNSKGEFKGDIVLNYYSMAGLYYVSVLAELPGYDYPIVVSRRTVQVG